MKCSTAIVTLSLLVGSAIGAPGSAKRQARAEARRARLDRRSSGDAHSNPLFAANTTTPAVALYGPEEEHVSFSSNWAGVVLIGSGYRSVTAQITVPTPSIPSRGSSSTQYCASAWVGIDGDTCTTAILQTGVDFCIRGSSVTYDAWYEWFPEFAFDFTGIPISAGNSIRMTVTATSTSSGTAVIQNLSTGRSVTHTFSSESNRLCETNAEWIVEDFSEGNSLVPFANFGTVTFTGASATTGSGTVGVTGGEVIDIQQNGQVLTSVATAGSQSVVVSYV